jgi:hypothetical protein
MTYFRKRSIYFVISPIFWEKIAFLLLLCSTFMMVESNEMTRSLQKGTKKNGKRKPKNEAFPKWSHQNAANLIESTVVHAPKNNCSLFCLTLFLFFVFFHCFFFYVMEDSVGSRRPRPSSESVPSNSMKSFRMCMHIV